ncbi:MAG: ABC transporter substrate-binding protein [Polyangiaceae bacterium]
MRKMVGDSARFSEVRSAWGGLARLVGSALCLLGCSAELAPPIPAAHPDDETPRPGGTLHAAVLADIRSLDPPSISDGIAPAMVELLYSGLVGYDKEGVVAPDLASRYSIDDGGLTYRFYLREGLRFHDGSEVTAKDIERSMRRALHPKSPNAMRSFYEGIVGFEAFTSGKSERFDGLTTEGKYVFAVRLKAPDATFLPLMALQSIRPVCPSAGELYSQDWKPCGAGPFKLDRWDHGQMVRLVRHDGFKPAPSLDAVEFQLNVTLLSQRLKFERGELDVLRDFAQPDLIRFQLDPRWKPYGVYDAPKQMGGEGMNVEMAPFDNIELRRAVAAAIDRDQYRLVKPGIVVPLTQPIPPGVKGHDDSLRCQKFDLDAALEHMRRAGYPYDPKTGKGGYPKPIPYLGYRQSLVEFTSQLLQQQLARIGIRLELRLVSYSAWLAISHRPKEVQMSYQGWNADYSDASDFTEPLFHSNAINAEDSNNSSFYRNPKLDALLDEGRRELVPAKRKTLYDQASELICDEAPWAFTYAVRFFNLRQPYVRGYEPHPFWAFKVGSAWLDRGSVEHGKRALLSPARTLPREGVR